MLGLLELKEQLDTQAFGGPAQSLTAASWLAALHPGQSLRCLSLSLPVRSYSLQREAGTWAWEAGELLQVGQPWLVKGARELLGQQCQPSPSCPSALTSATLSVLQGLLCPLQEAPSMLSPPLAASAEKCVSLWWWGGSMALSSPSSVLL